MSEQCIWFQCVHPELHHIYYVDIVSKKAVWHLFDSLSQSFQVHYLSSLLVPDSHNLIYYLSFV